MCRASLRHNHELYTQVKQILRKYSYPLAKQEEATETVLEQAAVLSKEWRRIVMITGRAERCTGGVGPHPDR